MQQQPPAQPGTPPLGLDGYCAVHLAERQEWTPGVPNDPRLGAIHRGRLYLFASPDCQQKFLADPDRYSPVLSGHDPVIFVERGQLVPGRREHGCFYGAEGNRRIVLFADEASYQAFERNPLRYAAQFGRQ
jgi:YHS domain-containing protein